MKSRLLRFVFGFGHADDGARSSDDRRLAGARENMSMYLEAFLQVYVAIWKVSVSIREEFGGFWWKFEKLVSAALMVMEFLVLKET